MRNTFRDKLLFASLLLPFVAAGQPRNLSNCLLCTVVRLTAQFPKDHGPQRHESYECVLNESDDPDHRKEQMFRINLSDNFIAAHRDRLNAKRPARICISGGSVDKANASIRFPQGAATPDGDESSFIMFVGGRQLQEKVQNASGPRSVLVVRVTSSDNGNSNSADHLAGAFFSQGPQAFQHSLVTQYDKCSHSQLQFSPASGNDNINNGVYELNMPDIATNGVDILDIVNTMTIRVQDGLGISSLQDTYNHIAFCMPPGTEISGSNEWLAFAYYNIGLSYYNTDWCDKLSAMMHEIGHNFNLEHSALGNDEYGDTSGMMGYSYSETNGPLMCFNGFKHWRLGWFDAQTAVTDLGATGASTIELASFVDYGKNSKPVLARLGFLFFQNNHAKEHNIGTVRFSNSVTVTQGGTSGVSYHVGALDQVGQTITIPAGTAGQNHPEYHVHLCSKTTDSDGADVALISIYTTGNAPVCTISPDDPVDEDDPDDQDKPDEPCDDTNQTFEWNNVDRNCGWLRYRSEAKRLRICGKSEQAAKACPESCLHCEDDCDDNIDASLNVAENGNLKTCQWVARYESRIRSNCVEGSDAWKHCRETCNSCESAQ